MQSMKLSTLRRAAGRCAPWLMLGAGAMASADNGVGSWLSQPGDNWPLIPIHATLTPDGRVITYGTRTGSGLLYDVWDPASGLGGGHITLPNQTQTNIFCGAQVVLPQDGSVFLAGGRLTTSSPTDVQGTNDTNLFAFSDNSLTRGNALNRPRYYSTTTTLVSGKVYIQGCKGGQDFPEVRDTSGNFHLLTGASTNSYYWDYPRDFVAPDGRVFGYDGQGHMYYVATSGLGSVAGAGQL